MIIKQLELNAGKINDRYLMNVNGDSNIYKDAIYLDLEHFIYKVPLCIGVFGVCCYNESKNKIEAVQYMIQSRKDAKEVLYMAQDYFKTHEKKYIITFAGENDFSVINFLFKKYKIKYDIASRYSLLDIQKLYHKYGGDIIGLKKLEKIFQIERAGELISGSSLARTFSKVLREPGYGERISEEKVERILQYNLSDVVNLFKITTTWNKFVTDRSK